MKNKGRNAKFLISLAGLGGFIALLASTRFTAGQAGTFLLLFALGVAAEWFSIPLRNGWTTVSEAIYYAGLMTLGPARGSILAFACVLGGYLAGTPRKNGPITLRGVLAGASLAFFPVLAAGKAYALLGSPHFLVSPLASLAALAAMAVLFNGLNNGLAMLYVYLEQRVNPFEMWVLNQLDEQLLRFAFVPPFLGLILAAMLVRSPLAALLLIPLICAVRMAIQRQTQLLANARKTMETLADALDQRDGSTYHHSMRVSHYAGLLARHIGVGEVDAEKIEWAAKIHDIGKIVILDNVLKKAGPLTDDEFHHMKYHPTAGAQVAGNLGFCQDEAFMVRCHHEKYDGTGYPHGLKGEEIPLGARIISVADFFDALTATRVYRKGMPVEEVTRLLESNKGRHFDPMVVDAFMDLLKKKGDLLVQAA